MIHKDELKYMRELCDKATPEPWAYDGMHDEIHCLADGHNYYLIISTLREFHYERLIDTFGHTFNPDFEFIAASRAMVPRMLDYINRLENEITHLKENK